MSVPEEGALPYPSGPNLSLSGSFGGPESREDLDLGGVWENGAGIRDGGKAVMQTARLSFCVPNCGREMAVWHTGIQR